jgi:hypothetical protein
MTTTQPYLTSEIDRLMLAVDDICKRNIDIAGERLLHPRALDTDEMGPDEVSSEQRAHSLDVLVRANRGDRSDRFGPGETKEGTDIGQPVIAEDINSHNRIKRLIRQSPIPALRNSFIVGEEASECEWNAAEDAPPGSLVLDVDPIDGSSNFDSMAFGFSTNVVAFRKTAVGKHYEMLLAMVIGSNRFTVAWQFGNRVFARYGAGAFLEIHDPISKAPRIGYTAAVAAMPHHRAKIAQLMETPADSFWDLPTYETGGKRYHEPAPTVYTMGGAPATIGLVIGRCSASVITSPQTIHDTAGVPAMLALNLHVFGAEGAVDRHALMKKFNALDRPKSGNYTPIPPLVIGRDAAFTGRLAERTYGAEPMDLIAVPRRGQPPKLMIIEGGSA